jgi:hypothetical protein
MVVHHPVLSTQYIFFQPLNQLRWARLFQGLQILMRVPSINLMQPWNYGSCVAKTQHSSIMGHRISSTMVELMQDVIKMPSSFIAILLQFHRNASYLLTLLCLIYSMKLNKHSFGVNLDSHSEMWCGSLMDLAWTKMVGTTSCANFSNSVKVKSVKDLNKHSVARMVTKTYRTPILGSTNCPPTSFNFIGVKNSQVFTHVIAACTAIWCSVSRNSLSLLWEVWVKTRCNKLHK